MNSINYGFTNVFEPLIGEVYFNFGYIGTIICGCILVAFMKHIDNIYLNSSLDKEFSFFCFSFHYVRIF